MDVITASCPQCGTQYQLKPEQLSVANGQVRCGVCMTIFQAIAQAPIVPPAPQRVKPQLPVKSSFVNEADEKLLGEIDQDDLFDDNSVIEKTDFTSTFDDLEKTREAELSPEFKKSQKDDDLSFLDSLKNVDDDESWAEKLLDDEGFDPKNLGKEKKEDIKKEALGSSSSDFDFDDLDVNLSLSRSEEEELGFSAKETLVNRITPEPLVFQILARNPLWITLAFGLAGLIGVLLMCFQLFYFQKDTLSREPKWHGFYASMCNTLGCSLPDLYSIDDMAANNLTVKSHPHYRNALLVDAIIINYANIEQPFPNIELFFSDKDQKIVAARQFKPKDYLRGELTTATLMPIKQSIHIALEIDDPGSNATNYSINLSY